MDNLVFEHEFNLIKKLFNKIYIRAKFTVFVIKNKRRKIIELVVEFPELQYIYKETLEELDFGCK